MAKSSKLEAVLTKLAEIRNQLGVESTSSDYQAISHNAPSVSEQTIEALRQVIQGKFAVAVAQAAKLVYENELVQLIPDLVKAFDRFLLNPVETDPNCHAKAGIADALYRLEYRQEEVFLQGIRHVQMEPVWGGKVDTAAKLRGICAMGLVRMNYSQVLVELADLLADPEPPARIAAARAIAYSGDPNGVPLLRLRARVGDEPAVLSECLAALLNLDADRSLPFVANVLNMSQPQTQELVALVLGESRLPAAFNVLRHWWEKIREPNLRRTGLLAIATLRQDEPIDFLLDLIATGIARDARDAVTALEIYQDDQSLWQRVEAAMEQRGDERSVKPK